MNYDDRHGGPHDRGSADAYYRRKKSPHYWTEGSYHGHRINENDMTADELKAYHAGYDGVTEFKY